ncbi:unnamed protein product [Ceutorhynchus assimilis]|uniref:PHD-type domain-containing protein n=1 Tax=Ceutorhynchus assimilis TaxID=467358 RepID=A0A9N9QIK6_9CUCU|nr:unnamed protein product [Ceutorhynchus assimilis]
MANSKTCKLCHRNIGKMRMKLVCGICKSYFHLDCGEVTEIDARIMQQDKTSWFCEDCTSERKISAVNQSARPRRSSILPTHSSPVGRDEGGIYELKSILRELQSDVREMKQSFEFLNEKYEEEKRRNKVMSDMVSEISKENEMLKVRVTKLEQTVGVQEANKIRNNICISGLVLSESRNDSTATKLVTLCDFLGVPTSESKFEVVKHFKTNNTIRSIVKVADLDLKHKILKAKAQKGRVTRRTVGLDESEIVIYVSEELTKETYNFLKECKRLRSEANYKYIWQKNGKVLARKADGDDHIVISDEDHLRELLG